MSNEPQILSVEEPPCPRVNTWAVGYPPGPFLTEPQKIELIQPKGAVESGVDIFFWNYRAPTTVTVGQSQTFIPGRRQQVCEFAATGDYVFEESLAGAELDQTKYSIRYSKPGRYSVFVRIYNVDQ